jgi:hypothetical protein
MADHSNYPVRLFSYGTLQLPSVQLATFGRRLDGVCDALCGYRVDTIEIVDAEVIRTSGSDCHAILVATSNPSDLVEGMVFSISEAELLNADDYERVLARCTSARQAWVYVAASDPKVS